MALTIALEATKLGVASIVTYYDPDPGVPWKGELRVVHGSCPSGAIGLENKLEGRGWGGDWVQEPNLSQQHKLSDELYKLLHLALPQFTHLQNEVI